MSDKAEHASGTGMLPVKLSALWRSQLLLSQTTALDSPNDSEQTGEGHPQGSLPSTAALPQDLTIHVDLPTPGNYSIGKYILVRRGTCMVVSNQVLSRGQTLQ